MTSTELMAFELLSLELFGFLSGYSLKIEHDSKVKLVQLVILDFQENLLLKKVSYFYLLKNSLTFCKLHFIQPTYYFILLLILVPYCTILIPNFCWHHSLEFIHVTRQSSAYLESKLIYTSLLVFLPIYLMYFHFLFKAKTFFFDLRGYSC